MKKVKKNLNLRKEGVEKAEASIQEMKVKVPSEGTTTICLQKGLTVKIGDFEFARIDAYCIRNIEDSDENIAEGLENISELLDEHLQKELDRLE